MDPIPSEPLETLPPRPTEPRARIVLLTQFGFSIALTILASMVYAAVALGAGWGEAALTGSFGPDATAEERWQMRLLLALSHLFTFVLAGAATVMLFYRRYVPEVNPDRHLDWRDYLGARRGPDAPTLLLSILLMLAAIPLVLYLYNANQEIPLPESLRAAEEQTEAAIKGLLNMETPWELVANLILIALLPALGEELVFRGVVQQQLLRRLTPPPNALITAAMIFSFAHFQFAGFLPRLFLGLVLGWLFWQTRNFWIPVIAHFVNNALQVVAQYLYHRQITTLDLEEDIHMPWPYALASAGATALLFWAIQRRTEHLDRVQNR